MIIVLGGAPGTGKTTIANLLVQRLNLAHHLSTGFIRSSISHLLPEDQARLLRRNSYDAHQELEDSSTGAESRVLEGAIRQAQTIKPSIETCIQRAIREGIGMVLEGTHCIPGILDPDALGATILCVLDVPDREVLKSRVLSFNHAKRSFTREQLGDLVHLQDQFLRLAIEHHQPVVVNQDLEEAIAQIRGLVGR